MRKLWIAGVVVVALTGCGSTNTGERAVFSRFGQVEPTCYKEGLYTYNPFTTSMTRVNVQVQKFEAKGLAAASADLQEIHADIVLNFAVNGEKCHELLQTVGANFKDQLIAPAISESLKAATAHYPVDRIIKERVALKDEIFKSLQARLNSYQINVRDVSLTNFGFSPAFAHAVEAKQIEEQNVQKQEYVRQQAVKNAESLVVKAEGDAKANRLMAESLRQSPETLRFKELEMMEKRWNGQLPTMILGSDARALISVPSPR